MKQEVTKIRSRLVNIAKGGQSFYEIQYTCDAKGIITIWGGREADSTAESDFILESGRRDEYIWLYRGRNGEPFGVDLQQRERAAQRNLTRDDIVNAYLEYRRQHPDHKGNLFSAMSGDGSPMYREDSEQVLQEVKRRNRAYIKEFYGEDIPLDYDFKKAYDEYLKKH